jgi:hypothetical protein
MRIVATFKGTDGSQGYAHGERYSLAVSRNTVIPHMIDQASRERHGATPYGSVEAFLRNWSDIEVRRTS